MPDPLLSSLCTICHVHPHKYRCPRCFVLTCSLRCIKRHKQWAQCNGVRDPTKYMKRSELATPKGIDHDYNYLTSIERELDYGEKNALSRGFVLEEEGRRSKQPAKGETQFNAAIERCGVIVTKAPKGMTRNKQNGTICSKKNRTLQWTVEWVHPDGKRTLDKLWETQRISTAYDDHLRHLDTSRPKKRRKPSDRNKDLVASTEVDSSNVPVHDSTAAEQLDGSTPTASVGKRKREDGEANANRHAEEENSNTLATTDHLDSEALQPSTSLPKSSNPPPLPAPEPPPSAHLTFHLHHPSLPSKHPVLIPLPPDAKLATSLTNRIVLEFPTIYVLHNNNNNNNNDRPDGTLPEGYVSEEDFFAAAKKEKRLIEEVAAGEERAVGGVGGGNVVEERKAGGLEDGEVDEGRLLEVLGRDLKGVAGLL